jgi:hypothetical protein
MFRDSSWVAGGQINPAVFVTQLHGTDNTVVQSVVGDCPVGISAFAPYQAPIPALVQAYAPNPIPCALTGQEITIYQDGETAPLTLGAGGCNAGDFLKPDANGNGVVCGNTDISGGGSAPYGAQAKQGGTAGAVVMVQIVRFRG